jgi:hypothetical protein
LKIVLQQLRAGSGMSGGPTSVMAIRKGAARKVAEEEESAEAVPKKKKPTAKPVSPGMANLETYKPKPTKPNLKPRRFSVV